MWDLGWDFVCNEDSGWVGIKGWGIDVHGGWIRVAS